MALETLNNVEKRTKQGTTDSRRMRAEGKIPAILYGKGKESESLALPAKDFLDAHNRHARVFQLSLGKEKVQALVKDVQYDHLGEDVLHVDLYRVKEGQKVRVKVQVEYEGHPKGVAAGGEFVHVISDLDVDCEVMHIPQSIPVKVGHLELNQSITVGDLQLPQGVTTPVSKDAIVCTVVQKALEPAPGTEAAVPGATEPELIGKKKEEGEEGEAAAEGGAKAATPAKEEKKSEKK